MAEAKKEEVKNDVGFLAEVAGQGFENVKADDVATPLLLISQALSEVTTQGTIPAGHFYNSVTGRDYGTQLRMVVCHFDKMWFEWKPNQGGLVGRYPVGGLDGVVGDKYSGMKHGENKVEEKMMFLVVLPDFPEEGYLVFSSTPGNMKYIKGWVTQMSNLRLDNGQRAPLFGAVWNVTLSQDTNKTGNKFFSCNENGKSSFKFDGWISQVVYQEAIQPAREVATQALALTDMSKEKPALEDNSEF